MLGFNFKWKLLTRLKSASKTFLSTVGKVDGHKAATLSMRWARPVFFTLTTLMLIIGWFYPEAIGTYFEALSKAPEWLTNILTILILGIAVEKGISRPLENVAKAGRAKRVSDQEYGRDENDYG